MAGVPAVCKNGHGFEDRSISLGEGSTDITFLRSGASACPLCGASASIMDGTYDVVGGLTVRRAVTSAVKTLVRPGISIEDLRTLQRILRESQAASAPPTDIQERVKKEAPSASNALDWMKSPSGVATATWLQFIIPTLLAVLAIIISLRQQQPKISPAQVKQIVKETVDSMPSGGPSSVPTTGPKARPRDIRPDEASQSSSSTAIPRRQSPGESCWCGSGTKYKHCHGRC